ncbi:golgin subfamily B member 1-like isoform X1 [Brachionus plicatilis]|uniref:Golgin subfamily B member 1-like isoform X1 n=1 Tax=Brachionus plicatilis TaxID=10195 RepID=A0A3M7S9H9_BRAPC|nr:golgin subfamily B member 1-like isoform X1 [Brachionus plicatilis]
MSLSILVDNEEVLISFSISFSFKKNIFETTRLLTDTQIFFFYHSETFEPKLESLSFKGLEDETNSVSVTRRLSQKETVISTIKSDLSSAQNKELLASGQIYDKDMEIRKLKSELCEEKSKTSYLNEEIVSKKKELSDSKLELCDLSSELKNIRSELVRRDQQINLLKDKIHEQNLEVSSLKKSKDELGSNKVQLNEEINYQYESRLEEMKCNVEELQNDKLKLSEEISQLQIKLKTNSSQSGSGMESLLKEMRARDQLIQKLRAEILDIQDKRDQAIAELEKTSNKLSQIEYKYFFLEEEI